MSELQGREGVREFDVIVLGAGMVGSLFALLLTQDPAARTLRVAVIDAEMSSLPAADAPFDLRVSALTRASEDLIVRAGCGPALSAQRLCRFTDMDVWDADGTGGVHFRAGEVGESHLGLLVENRILQAVLCDALWRQPAVTAYCPRRVQSLQPLRQGWQITLADGERLSAPLVIGADGAHSRVREAAGLGVSEWQYHQKAVVCTVTTERSHVFTAWQRFLPEGPLAFLPLADEHQCSIVWTLPVAEAERLQALPPEHFAVELGRAFEHKLGAITAIGPRAAFPLVARHAEHYTRDGLALIGDAAHSIHPLAGQGVNLGLLDAGVLADEVLAVLRAGLPAHHPRALSRYSRQRRGHNALLMHSMTGFERLFAARASGLRVLRNTGMRLFDRSGLIKHWVMRSAIGR